MIFGSFLRWRLNAAWYWYWAKNAIFPFKSSGVVIKNIRSLISNRRRLVKNVVWAKKCKIESKKNPECKTDKLTSSCKKIDSAHFSFTNCRINSDMTAIQLVLQVKAVSFFAALTNRGRINFFELFSTRWMFLFKSQSSLFCVNFQYNIKKKLYFSITFLYKIDHNKFFVVHILPHSDKKITTGLNFFDSQVKWNQNSIKLLSISDDIKALVEFRFNFHPLVKVNSCQFPWSVMSWNFINKLWFHQREILIQNSKKNNFAIKLLVAACKISAFKF